MTRLACQTARETLVCDHLSVEGRVHVVCSDQPFAIGWAAAFRPPR